MPKYRALCAALMLAAPSVLSACADNESSLYVEAVLAPKAPACEYKPDPGSVRLLGGTMDLAFTGSYTGIILVANQLAPRGDKDNLRTETMGVDIEGAEVRVTDGAGDELEAFSVPAGGFVAPNDSDEPGYGISKVTLIPSSITGYGGDLYDELSAEPSKHRTLVANVRVFGKTLGGIEVTSGEFKHVVDVCYGCSVRFPAEAMVGGQCLIVADAPKESQCTAGQDGPIDCRNCVLFNQDACLQP